MPDKAPHAQVLTRACPAKVNLALSVGPPRPGDGYHPIASWMVALTFGDELQVRRADETQFDIAFAPGAPRSQPIDWPLEKDLAYRALQGLEALAERPLPTCATIVKRIPTGAGLGGGSSDAAAMLVAARELHQLDVSDDALLKLAMPIGSDVVFLTAALLGRPSALVTGVGDQITDAPLQSPVHVVLAFPPVSCPTGPVYRAFDEAFARGHALRERDVRAMAASAALSAELFNDLAGPACTVQPTLRDHQAALAASCDRPAHVTGSGSTLFVLAASEAEAKMLAETAARDTGMPTVATQSL